MMLKDFNLKEKDIKMMSKLTGLPIKDLKKLEDFDIVSSKEECAKYLYGKDVQYSKDTDLGDFLELSDGRYIILA